MRFPIFRATLDLNNDQAPLGNYVSMADLYPLQQPLGGVAIPVIQVDMVSGDEVTSLAIGCTETEAAAFLTTLRLALEETRRLNAQQESASHPLGASHLDAEPVGGTAKADPMQEYEESAERLRQKREAFRRGEADPHQTAGTGNDNVFAQFFGVGSDPDLVKLAEGMGQSLVNNCPELVAELLANQGMKVCDTCKGKGILKQGQGSFIVQTTCTSCRGLGMINIEPPQEPPAAVPVPPTDPAPAPATDAAPIPPTNTDGAQVPPPTPT